MGLLFIVFHWKPAKTIGANATALVPKASLSESARTSGGSGIRTEAERKAGYSVRRGHGLLKARPEVGT